MTFNRNRRGFFTMFGDSVEKCISTLKAEGADFIGTNCTLTPKDMIPLSDLLKQSDLPILIQPNAGQPEVRGNTVHYGISPDDFADQIREFLLRDIHAVGGCCGTTPAHINDAYARSQAKGYVPFCTVRDLDRLTINPGHEPD